MSIDGISSYIDTTASSVTNDTTALTNTLNSVSSDSSDEELLQACKDFTSYFVEEVIKEVEENLKMDDDDEDSSMSTLKDFYMDSAIEEISDKLVDEVGSSFTQQLYEQMKRNYSI